MEGKVKRYTPGAPVLASFSSNGPSRQGGASAAQKPLRGLTSPEYLTALLVPACFLDLLASVTLCLPCCLYMDEIMLLIAI